MHNCDTNLMIEQCKKGSPERNATLLACEVCFAYEEGVMPYPSDLLAFIYLSQAHAIITDTEAKAGYKSTMYLAVGESYKRPKPKLYERIIKFLQCLKDVDEHAFWLLKYYWKGKRRK